MANKKFLNIRIFDALEKKLDKLASNTKMNKSTMIRQMIVSLIDMNIMQSSSQADPELILLYRKPNMTVNKVLIRTLFDLITDEKSIKLLAEQDFELGKVHRESLKKLTTDGFLDVATQSDPLEQFIKTRINMTHGPNALNWLDRVDLTIRGKSYYINGEHRQGMNFSKYMTRPKR